MFFWKFEGGFLEADGLLDDWGILVLRGNSIGAFEVIEKLLSSNKISYFFLSGLSLFWRLSFLLTNYIYVDCGNTDTAAIFWGVSDSEIWLLSIVFG